MNNINKYFDKIYCLTLLEYQDRSNNMKRQFNKLNINVDFIETVKYKFPINNFDSFLFEDVPGNSSAILLCTLNHYSIIKKSYLLGYNNILVFEDDIIFTNNIDKIYETFDNIPSNYDILRLCYPNYIKELDIPDKYFIQYNLNVWGTNVYALSRNGMKYYIDYLDNKLCQSDLPLYDLNKIIQHNLINYYCTNNIFTHNIYLNSTLNH